VAKLDYSRLPEVNDLVKGERGSSSPRIHSPGVGTGIRPVV